MEILQPLPAKQPPADENYRKPVGYAEGEEDARSTKPQVKIISVFRPVGRAFGPRY